MVRRCTSIAIYILLAALITFLAAVCLFVMSTIVSPRPTFGSVINYSAAEQKAREALLVQIGADKALADTGQIIYGLAVKYTTAPVVDTTLAAAYIVRSKTISTKEFSSPVIPGAGHSITVTPDKGVLLTVWRF